MQTLHHGIVGAADNNSPDFSVSVKTDGGWICVAEFRTQHEAVSLAEAATERSGLHAMIRRCGQTIAVLQPEECCIP